MAQANLTNYAVAPTLGDGTNPIIWDAETRKMAKAASAALKTDFDCSGKRMKLFLTMVSDRAEEFGWDQTIMMIPKDPATDMLADLRDITVHYGKITIEQVQDFAKRFVGQENLAAQHDMMLYKCLSKSLTDEAREKVSMFSDIYRITPINEPESKGINSGLVMLKVIIQESYIDTNFTVRAIREKLSSLDLYMEEVGSDVEKFNNHVRYLVESLAARGEETKDLLPNLFKGYKAASDTKFVEYIERQEEKYDDGEPVTEKSLMVLAKNKYDARIEKKLWSTKPSDKSEIIALQAQVDEFKAFMATQKSATPTWTTAQGRRRVPAWMNEKPKDGEPKTKQVRGKKYHWCPKHNRWVVHDPKDCKLKVTTPGETAATPASTATATPNTRLSLASGLQALLDQEGSDEE